MPIYEYACGKCGHEFEVEQRITEDPVKTCPSCRARKVKRLISQTSFVLKGGGWYSDLYSSTKGDSGDKSEKGESGSGSSSESKSGAASTSQDAPKKGGDKKGKKGSSPKAAA